MSILGLAQDYKGSATAGFRDLASMERNREMKNDANKSSFKLAKHQQKMAKRGQTASMALMAGGMGAAGMGAKLGIAGGPVGMAIGAAAGFLLGSLF